MTKEEFLDLKVSQIIENCSAREDFCQDCPFSNGQCLFMRVGPYSWLELFKRLGNK